MATAIIAYIPVIHQGYVQFIVRHPEATAIYLLTKEFLPTDNFLRKDIRVLDPSHLQTALHSLFPDRHIVFLDEKSVVALQQTELVMPDEEVTRSLAATYFSKSPIIWDSVFLRWDSQKSLAPVAVTADKTIAIDALHHRWLTQAGREAQKSSDWWRQVGAVLVKDDQVLLTAYNHHVPSEFEPYFNGDPRANFHKGEHIDKSTALHAEAGLITEAARTGQTLVGTHLYVTTFPCPNCAKLIAYSGITKLYFSEGYAMVDGESILKNKGVEIIQLSPATNHA